MFERFRALSPSRQLVLIAIGVCAFSVLIGAMWFFFLRTEYRPLFSNLRSADAATIIADLDKKKIPYQLANDGTTVLVPADRVAVTRLDVMTEDLPLKGTVGFELFNKSDIGLTDFAQKINYQRALQGELERTIMTLDGVDSARVHLSLGEDRIFRDDRVPPKASVTIRMRDGKTLSAAAAQGIQRLVAAAVPKLDIANVVILDEEGQVIGSQPEPRAADAALAPQAQEKRAIEQYYAARIRQTFDSARLADGANVSVAAIVPAEGDAPGLQQWTPETRKFPLQITITSETDLDSSTQENLRNLAIGAIGPNLANSDIVNFSTSMSAVAPPANAPPRPQAAPQAAVPFAANTAAEEPGWFSELALGLLPLLALIGIFVLIRRARGPRKLSEKQRADFVARLRTALDQGDVHAASRF